VAYSLTILRMALKAAERDRLVSRNVALDVDPPRTTRKEIVILTMEQARAVIADGDPLWTLLVTTGLRLGEALALRAQDIDGETIRVTGSLRPLPASFRGTGPRLARVEPKTASGWRTVTLPVPIAWPEPDPPNIDGLVFTSPTGAPRDPRTVSREWTETRLRLGIGPEVTIHALRHTAVSLALASGATLDDVKRMVGHSTIAMTSDTYGHLVEGRSREVADRLATFLATTGRS
jgi:integrase